MECLPTVGANLTESPFSVNACQVLSALDGAVKLAYSGHRKVAYGIELALLDNPLIRSVEFDYVEE